MRLGSAHCRAAAVMHCRGLGWALPPFSRSSVSHHRLPGPRARFAPKQPATSSFRPALGSHEDAGAAVSVGSSERTVSCCCPTRRCPLPPPPLAACSAALAAERRRREEAEAKLSRALENNTALARGNLRLQEQCARLRGEADLRQHEEGCQRAAAAAREQEVSAKLARLQALVRRGAEERETLLRQLAGKQEVIAYLEGKLAERAAAADTNGGGSVQLGAASATPAAAADAAANVKADGQVVQRSQSPAGSLDAAAPVPAGREPRQRVPLGASEVEEAPSVGEVSSGTPAGPELAGDSGAADAGGGEDAEQEASKRAGASRSLAPAAAAVGEEAQQSRPRQLPSLPAAAAEQTPAPPRKQQQTGSNRCGERCMPLPFKTVASSWSLFCSTHLCDPAAALRGRLLLLPTLPAAALPLAWRRPPFSAPPCAHATASAMQSPA